MHVERRGWAKDHSAEEAQRKYSFSQIEQSLDPIGTTALWYA
jgi:hypothetical protein